MNSFFKIDWLRLAFLLILLPTYALPTPAQIFSQEFSPAYEKMIKEGKSNHLWWKTCKGEDKNRHSGDWNHSTLDKI